MKSDFIICWTPFNYFLFPFKGWDETSVHPVLTKVWIRNRYEIWKRFTYRSIAEQGTDFTYFIMCNILAKRFTDAVFRETTMRDRRVKLLYFGTHEYNCIMRQMREREGCSYSIRVDSDDMYSKGTFDYILNRFPEGYHCGYFKEGYGYSQKLCRMWNYDCCGSGPFYVQKYQPGMYRFDPVEHTYIKKMGAAILEPGHFTVNVHDENHSTACNSRWFGEEVHDPKKSEIMRQFSL